MDKQMIDANELKKYFAYLANVRFKSSASPYDEWYKFTVKEVQEIIDKFVSISESEDK